MSAERRRMSRDRILVAAAQLLDSGVYGSLTVDALARSMHMSKSTLYKYFESKTDVVVELVENACRETERDLEEAWEGLENSDPSDALEAMLGVYASHGERLPRAVILEPHRAPAKSRKRLAITRAAVASACTKVVRRGASNGSFKFAQPELLATAVVASAEAAIIAGARGELVEDRAESVRALYPLFLPGALRV